MRIGRQYILQVVVPYYQLQATKKLKPNVKNGFLKVENFSLLLFMSLPQKIWRPTIPILLFQMCFVFYARFVKLPSVWKFALSTTLYEKMPY